MEVVLFKLCYQYICINANIHSNVPCVAYAQRYTEVITSGSLITSC